MMTHRPGCLRALSARGCGDMHRWRLDVTWSAAAPFQATATDANAPSSAASIAGSVAVLGLGLDLTLTPPTGAPGDSFVLTVMNTGATTENCDLIAGGAG